MAFWAFFFPLSFRRQNRKGGGRERKREREREMPARHKKNQRGTKKGHQRIQGQKRKGTTGNAANFVTRKQAIKKLQVSLQQFRKLCIIHGIYPRDPRNSPKGKDKTYFYMKDLLYLAHDPMMKQYRNYGAWKKKVTKAKHKREKVKMVTLHKNKPKYRLDHVVLRRYPTFDTALEDIDDALSMIYLFASAQPFKKNKTKMLKGCQNMTRQWESVLASNHLLRKVFVSIKGIYYQAEVLGHEVTWMVPHQFTYEFPKDVDLNVMMSFLEFYESLMSFVLFKLYHDREVAFPPPFLPVGNVFPCALSFDKPRESLAAIAAAAASSSSASSSSQTKKQLQTKKRLKSLEQKMDTIVEEDADELDTEVALRDEEEGEEGEEEDFKDEIEEHALGKLFEKCKFFVGRECPKRSLDFCIKACGGELSWECEENHLEPFKEGEVTHRIIDRPVPEKEDKNCNFVQPQWVYDSLNAGILLPVEEYAPGVELPPHLSPFVDDEQEGYVPDQRKHLDDLIARAMNQKSDILEAEGEGEEGVVVGKLSEKEREARFQEELEKEAQGISFSEAKGKEKEEGGRKRAREEEEEEESEEEEEDEEKEDEKLAAIMIPSKKKRRLYQRIQHSQQQKKTRTEILQEKKKAGKK